jgi:hypothetical protein
VRFSLILAGSGIPLKVTEVLDGLLSRKGTVMAETTEHSLMDAHQMAPSNHMGERGDEGALGTGIHALATIV